MMGIVKQYRKGNFSIEVGWMPKRGKKQWFISTTDHSVKHPTISLAGDILLQSSKTRAMKNFEKNATHLGLKKLHKVI